MKSINSIKYKVIVSFTFALLLIMSACTKLTDGYSTDPVSITDGSVISTFKYLSGVELALIGAYEGDVSRTVGMWDGHFNGTDRQYIGIGNYSVSGRDFDTEWAAIYSQILENTKIIKSKAKFETNYRVLGIAQVIEAMALGLAADLWGDVPFSEATQYPVITTPKYDAQASVYAGVQVKLDSAIINLAKTVPSKLVPSSNDFLFQGNSAKWIAAANTLKARYYLHVKDYTNALLYSNSGISSTAGNLKAPHGSSYQQNFNLYYSFLSYDRSGYMAGDGFAAKLMDAGVAGSRNNASTDETGRLNYFYAPLSVWGGLNTGAQYDVNVLWSPDWGTPSKYNGFFAATASFPLVTYEENILIKAEAYAKGTPADFANSLATLNSYRAYLNSGAFLGSSTGYLGWGVTYSNYASTDFNAGGIENADNIAPIDALVREIIEERYCSLTGQLETFNDVRRTHNLLKVPIVSGHSNFPQRILYPQSEKNTNANVPKTGVTLDDPTPVNATSY